MGILVTNLTTGKGTWNNVSDLISSEDWKKVYIITNKFGAEKFSHNKQFSVVIIDIDEPANIIRDKIIAGLSDLRDEIGFNDVAINFSSGSGKEHMALLSAVLKIGVGIRIVDVENKILKNI